MSEFAPDLDMRMREAARLHPLAPAIADATSTLSWGQFDATINRVSHSLLALHRQRAPRVALLADNSLQAVCVFFGAQRAGNCVVPLPTAATAEALRAMIDDSDADVLFISETYLALTMDDRGIAADTVQVIPIDGEGENSLDAFLRHGDDAYPDVELRPELEYNVIYSSGTTGTPKGIVQSRAFRAYDSGDTIERFGMDSTARTIVTTPIYSNTTLFALLAVLAAGGFAYIMRKFEAAAFIHLCHEVRPSHIVLVPTQYDRILRHPSFAGDKLDSFRSKFSTSSALPVSLKRAVLKEWPAGGLYEFYGMTEGGISTCLAAHEHPDKLDSVGTPDAGVEIKFLNEQDQQVCAGETGEIIGHSPAMMNGYLNQPLLTRSAFWEDASGKRYVRSGDIGRQDEDGFVFLLGRQKDLIISGGFNIYASDLEAVLAQDPSVREVCVVARPCARWGETPAAFLVAEDGSTIDEARVLQIANDKLGKHQRISEVRVVDNLPRNPLGKILKATLRTRLRDELIAREDGAAIEREGEE